MNLSIINIFLNLIFIKLFLLISELWATAGAASATTICWVLYFILAVSAAKKEFNFKLYLKDLYKPIISSLIATGILVYLSNFIQEMTYFLGGSLIILYILIYFILMILIKGIIKEDFNLFTILIKR